jgi:hypothetical protein
MEGIGFPSIPTDNLYKFLALTGVAIVIATFYIEGNLATLAVRICSP